MCKNNCTRNSPSDLAKKGEKKKFKKKKQKKQKTKNWMLVDEILLPNLIVLDL